MSQPTQATSPTIRRVTINVASASSSEPSAEATPMESEHGNNNNNNNNNTTNHVPGSSDSASDDRISHSRRRDHHKFSRHMLDFQPPAWLDYIHRQMFVYTFASEYDHQGEKNTHGSAKRSKSRRSSKRKYHGRDQGQEAEQQQEEEEMHEHKISGSNTAGDEGGSMTSTSSSSASSASSVVSGDDAFVRLLRKNLILQQGGGLVVLYTGLALYWMVSGILESNSTSTTSDDVTVGGVSPFIPLLLAGIASAVFALGIYVPGMAFMRITDRASFTIFAVISVGFIVNFISVVISLPTFPMESVVVGGIGTAVYCFHPHRKSLFAVIFILSLVAWVQMYNWRSRVFVPWNSTAAAEAAAATSGGGGTNSDGGTTSDMNVVTSNNSVIFKGLLSLRPASYDYWPALLIPGAPLGSAGLNFFYLFFGYVVSIGTCVSASFASAQLCAVAQRLVSNTAAGKKMAAGVKRWDLAAVESAVAAYKKLPYADEKLLQSFASISETIRDFSRYVPRGLIGDLRCEGDVPDQVGLEEKVITVMVIEMANFTQITDFLAGIGPDGTLFNAASAHPAANSSSNIKGDTKARRASSKERRRRSNNSSTNKQPVGVAAAAAATATAHGQRHGASSSSHFPRYSSESAAALASDFFDSFFCCVREIVEAHGGLLLSSSTAGEMTAIWGATRGVSNASALASCAALQIYSLPERDELLKKLRSAVFASPQAMFFKSTLVPVGVGSAQQHQQQQFVTAINIPPDLASPRIRVGIHRGWATVGNIGSEDYHSEYTAFGSAVRWAKALSGVNRAFGSSAILVSEQVLEEARKWQKPVMMPSLRNEAASESNNIHDDRQTEQQRKLEPRLFTVLARELCELRLRDESVCNNNGTATFPPPPSAPNASGGGLAVGPHASVAVSQLVAVHERRFEKPRIKQVSFSARNAQQQRSGGSRDTELVSGGNLLDDGENDEDEDAAPQVEAVDSAGNNDDDDDDDDNNVNSSSANDVSDANLSQPQCDPAALFSATSNSNNLIKGTNNNSSINGTAAAATWGGNCFWARMDKQCRGGSNSSARLHGRTTSATSEHDTAKFSGVADNHQKPLLTEEVVHRLEAEAEQRTAHYLEASFRKLRQLRFVADDYAVELLGIFSASRLWFTDRRKFHEHVTAAERLLRIPTLEPVAPSSLHVLHRCGIDLRLIAEYVRMCRAGVKGGEAIFYPDISIVE